MGVVVVKPFESLPGLFGQLYPNPDVSGWPQGSRYHKPRHVGAAIVASLHLPDIIGVSPIYLNELTFCPVSQHGLFDQLAILPRQTDCALEHFLRDLLPRCIGAPSTLAKTPLALSPSHASPSMASCHPTLSVRKPAPQCIHTSRRSVFLPRFSAYASSPPKAAPGFKRCRRLLHNSRKRLAAASKTFHCSTA